MKKPLHNPDPNPGLINPSATDRVLSEMRDERERQDAKWGPQLHGQLKFLAILVEEVGEVAKAILERDTENYRTELIQVGAVAGRASEAFDAGLQSP